MNGMREGYDVDDWEDFFEYLNNENKQKWKIWLKVYPHFRTNAR
jgi:hypothetical protein